MNLSMNHLNEIFCMVSSLSLAGRLIGSDTLIVKIEALIDEIQSDKAIMNKKSPTIGQTDLQPYPILPVAVDQQGM